MTVYNRKMFRKKAGGATGIMASGPELIKRANGGTFTVGPRNPSQIIVNPPIQTSAGGPGTYSPPTFIPSGDNSFAKSILNSLMKPMMGPGPYMLDQIQREKESKFEKEVKEANKRAGKSIIGPTSQAGIEKATGAEIISKQPDKPGFISDTIANLKLFKENMTPTIEEFKKNYTDLGSIFSKEGFNKFVKGKVDKLKKTLKEQQDERSALDASGEKQGAIGAKALTTLKDIEKQDRIQLGFLKSDQEPSEGELVNIDGKDKLKTVTSDGTKVIRDLSEKEKKTFSVAENLKDVGNDEYDKKQLATTEEGGQGNKLNQTVAKLDSDSEKSEKDGLTSTSTIQKTFRDGLSVFGDDKTKSNIGSILGIQTFDNMSLGERTQAYKSILRETLGEDKDIKSDADFNLIMTGLLIASGDSPDALTNIARGLASGLKMYSDNLSDKRKEKKEIALAATKLAITADEAAKERSFKAEQGRLDRVSKEFIALASKTGDRSKLKQDIYKKLVSNPDGYLGLRDKLTYANLSDNEKPAYLNQIATNLTNTFYQSGVTGSTTNISNEDLKGHMDANKKAKADGADRYTYNGQVFAVQ